MKYGIILRNGVSGKPVVKQIEDLSEIRILDHAGWYEIHAEQLVICLKYLNQMVKFIIDDGGKANVVDIVK